MKNSLKTLSRITGYSTATVSRALSNSGNVREEVRKRIINAAREIGYSAGSSRVLVIGEMLAPSFYHDNLLPYLADALYRSGFCVEFIAKRDVNQVLDQNFRGAISLLREGIEQYWGNHHNIPLVCINSSAAHLHSIYSVCNDDCAGCAAMATTLVELGHRKIGLFGDSVQLICREDHPYYLNRMEAFLQVMRKNGLPDDLLAGKSTQTDTVSMVKSLLDRGCTALIGNGETAGVEIYQALQVLGMKIPDDVSVMTWIAPSFAGYYYPPASGVVQDFERIAGRAVEMLQMQINGEHCSSDTVIPPLTVIGSSVARCQ